MVRNGTLKVVHSLETRAIMSSDRLDSWKEVAAYLKRGARTVQRWEREEGMPVHRLRHDKLGSVYAFKSELDAWWSGRGAVLDREGGAESDPNPSVAVLRFADLSQEKDQAYFCDGMAEEIINVLSRIDGLRVASRTSSFQFTAPEIGSREIARRLGVKTLLEGSIRKSGACARIAVQLIDAETGFQLRSARYDREIRDIFAVQDEIARDIVCSLTAELVHGRRGERLPSCAGFA